jgi:hypothetical protein
LPRLGIFLLENRLNKFLRRRAERELFAARTGQNGVRNVLGYVARPPLGRVERDDPNWV